MNMGLILQVCALGMLKVPNIWLTVPWVMATQAVSGIAKDLNKMSAKNAIKTLVSDEQQGVLYKWIAILTGSKNALKGAGFFVGGLLLSTLGFRNAVMLMAVLLALVFVCSLMFLEHDLGKAKQAKPNIKLNSNIFFLNHQILIFYQRQECFFLVLEMFGLWLPFLFILVLSLDGMNFGSGDF